jgi:hypothetical protein
MQAAWGSITHSVPACDSCQLSSRTALLQDVASCHSNVYSAVCNNAVTQNLSLGHEPHHLVAKKSTSHTKGSWK